MTVAIGVVAHHKRVTQAWDLAAKVEASFMSVDRGEWGAKANHLKVWQFLVKDYADKGITEFRRDLLGAVPEWLVVLEDDAMPCNDFRNQLDMALEVAPTNVVSLYLGTSYPPAWQQFIYSKDREPAHWSLTVDLLHAVGVAIRTELVLDMLNWVEPLDMPIDAAISTWCRAHARTVGSTRPSLVDHRDDETLIKHPDGDSRELPRRAWQFGERDYWTSSAVWIP